MFRTNREQNPWTKRLTIGAGVVGGVALGAALLEVGRRFMTPERRAAVLGAVGIGGEPDPVAPEAPERPVVAGYTDAHLPQANVLGEQPPTTGQPES